MSQTKINFTILLLRGIIHAFAFTNHHTSFVPERTRHFTISPHKKVQHRNLWLGATDANTEGSPDIINKDLQVSGENGEDEAQETESNISSFLKFLGPYPSLGLRFPSLSTESQRERGVVGISLDFVLDTAANTNTINAQVAQELKLESVGSALPGYGAGGAIDGGDTFLLGNCTLEVPDANLFMTELTASALPVASPASAGILGVAFLNCFQGGVKFQWGGGIDKSDPLVTFYGDAREESLKNQLRRMTRVPIDVIKDIYLPSVMMKVNGVEIPALLDTGSPITVFNPVAADLAGLDVIDLNSNKNKDEASFGGFNPFKKITDNFKAAQATAQAATRGDVLMMMGSDGKTIELKKTNEKVRISLGGNNDDGTVTFPRSNVFVGNLPGLAALGGLEGSSSPPAAVLGMDVLKRLPVMIYRQNEVYF